MYLLTHIFVSNYLFIKVKEMENLFLDTVTKLSTRVNLLEKRGTDTGDDENVSSGPSYGYGRQGVHQQHHQHPPSTKNQGGNAFGGGGGERGVQMLPGGRLRPVGEVGTRGGGGGG